MEDREVQILKKILSELSVAKTLLGDTNLPQFLDDELLKRACCMTVIVN